jgi:hypothetical protein
MNSALFENARYEIDDDNPLTCLFASLPARSRNTLSRETQRDIFIRVSVRHVSIRISRSNVSYAHSRMCSETSSRRLGLNDARGSVRGLSA